jgi:hypothetical protein
MVRLFAFSVLAIGCASAGTPEPRVVERVVYVEAPCQAPVIVEHHGHPASRHDGRHHDQSRHDAKPRSRSKSKHHAKGKPAGHPNGKHGSQVARGSRCDDKPTAKARERCRRKAARRGQGKPNAFGF